MGYKFVGATDFLQGEKEGVLRVDSVVNSRGSESQESRDTVSIGLELWTLSCWEVEPNKRPRDLGFSVMEPPSCGSSKRARAPNAGSQVPSCLVDGCNSDLSKCRDYHRRHKVCELHSKTPKVTIRGQEQRFCQQCSRFHSLGEFDDGKRSCRKRLDGHNRRRRKSQPDTSLSSSHFLANYHGTKFMPVSSTQLFPSSALANCSWGGIVKPETDPMLYGSSSSSRHQLLDFTDRKMISVSSPHVYRPQFQFPFMTGNRNMSCGSSDCEPTLNSNPMSGNNSDCSSQKMLPNFLSGALSNSDCALSLLSSSLPAPAQGSSHKGMSTMMQFNPTEPSLSTMSAMQYSRVGTGEPMGSFLAAPGSLHGMFRSGHDESSASGSQSHHIPSFTWE